MFHRLQSNMILPQWFTGLAVSLLVMQMGFTSGWASPSLAKLAAPDSPIPALNPEQISWVASLLNLGRLVGAVLGAVAGNCIGNKKAILLTLVIAAIGWLATALANAVEWLYVARIFSGIGVGMSFSTFPLYIGEVSMMNIRGALVSIAGSGGPIGQIISSVCGSYMSISSAAAIYLACCIILIVIFSFFPESPHHLVKMAKVEEAQKSIRWYRAGRGVDTELEAVQKFVTTSGTESFIDKLKQFGTPSVRFATFQIIALYTFMQISGLNSVAFYMEIILIRANFNLFNPSHAAIYANIVSAVATLLPIFLIDKFGRRMLVLISSIGICISMMSLSTFFFLMDNNVDTQNIQWLPVVSMFLFFISFCSGLMTVPNTVLSEMFPANIKSIAACIASLTGALVAFLSSKTYQPMVDLMGESSVFLVYAISAMLAVPYVLFYMPETKGKSLLQIQAELDKI